MPDLQSNENRDLREVPKKKLAELLGQINEVTESSSEPAQTPIDEDIEEV